MRRVDIHFANIISLRWPINRIVILSVNFLHVYESCKHIKKLFNVTCLKERMIGSSGALKRMP